MKLSFRYFSFISFVALLFNFNSTVFAQENWPNRPITMVIPFPPGGVADTVGRPVADALSRSLGQPVIVENRPGAGGGIGMAAAQLSGHILEGLYLNENSNEIDNHRLFSNIMEASLQKVKNYKLSDKQLLETLEIKTKMTEL